MTNFRHNAAAGDLEKRLGMIPEGSRLVLIGFNPRAGSTASNQSISKLSDTLRGRGFSVQLETELERIADVAAGRFAAGDLRVVVAAGGDGTVALLANHLPPEIPITVFPLGTENLLAKHLGLVADPIRMTEWIAEGQTAQLDAGQANGKLFFAVASCGFDAEVVHQLHGERKGNINRLSYAAPILRSIASYRYPRMRVRCDGGTEIESRWVFAFNIPQYALQLPVADDASCLDGRLDTCSFRGGSFWRSLLYVAGVVLRQHRNWKDTFCAQFERMTIEADEPVPFQLDGDPGGHLPLEIQVVPRRLRVLVSKKWLQSNVGNLAVQETY